MSCWSHQELNSKLFSVIPANSVDVNASQNESFENAGFDRKVQNSNESTYKKNPFIYEIMHFWKFLGETHPQIYKGGFMSPSSPCSTVHLRNDIWFFISLLMQRGRHFVLLLAACCQHFFTASGCISWAFFLLKSAPVCSPRTQQKGSTPSAAPTSHPQEPMGDM